MKRLLFCIENFKHGGIPQALNHLVSLLDKDKYEISIFVVNPSEGPYKQIFKSYLKYEEDKLLEFCCLNYKEKKGIEKYALISFKLFRKSFSKIFKFDIFKFRLNKWRKRISNDNFDCVIAFAEGYLTEFVSGITGKKIAWIHMDYKRLQPILKINEENFYEKFEKIIIPSKFSVNSFIDVYPKLSNKVVNIPNLLNQKNITNNSESTIPLDKKFKTNKFTIISVGRICYEKRFYEIPEIAKYLKDNSLDFYWYILGDGSETEKRILLDNIKKFDVNNEVILLGNKSNPYPYIKNSDLLVCLSFSETFSYVVYEAKTLGVPIILTDVGSVDEIISSNEGIVSKLNEIGPHILSLLNNKQEKLLSIKDNLKHYHYDNSLILNKLEKIFNT